MRRLVRWYGAGPLHLAALVGSFAVAGYAAARLLPPNPVGVLAWFVAGVVGHDLVLLPLYSLLDRSAAAVLRRRGPAVPAGRWRNHLRVPAVLSGLLLLVYFPLILRLPAGLAGITGGHSAAPYLRRWLLVTGLLFLGSAVSLALRQRRARRPASGAGEQQVLDEQRGGGLDGEPAPVRASREQCAGGDQPERER